MTQTKLSILALTLVTCFILLFRPLASSLGRSRRVSPSAQPSPNRRGVPPLVWSPSLFNSTSLLVRYQRDKNGCNFANLTSGKYGGNQFWSSGQLVTPGVVVDTWVKEKEFYNHSDYTCVGDHQCGVYTQVVWKKSVELGCAQASCVKDQSTLFICFYSPPGNYVGESPC